MPTATENARRVNFFDKQFLRVDEFRDEQLYQLAFRRRHNAIQHSWGIVTGLEIVIEESAPIVRPGLAIDGYGRELLLKDKKRLSVDRFDTLGTEVLDVWLVYARRDGERVPNGYASCSETDPLQTNRSDETPEIILEKKISNTIDPRKPPGVPAELLDVSVPPTSDNPKDTWRVYLGRITRLAVDEFTIDISQRPYSGLVGEVVDHPANATRVEIGKSNRAAAVRKIGNVTYVYKKEESDQDGRRFAVFLPEDMEPNPTNPSVDLLPRLEIRDDGRMLLRGHTVLNGDLRLTGGAVQFVRHATFDTDNIPAEPSIYRVLEAGADQLRIDLGADNSSNRQFVIGFSTPDGKFNPCFKVELKPSTDTGDLAPLVTIYGDLKVHGRVQPDLPERKLSAEAKSAVAGSFQAGVSAGNPAS